MFGLSTSVLAVWRREETCLSRGKEQVCKLSLLLTAAIRQNDYMNITGRLNEK